MASTEHLEAVTAADMGWTGTGGIKDQAEESSADTQISSPLKKRKVDTVDQSDGGDGERADEDVEAEEEMDEEEEEDDDDNGDEGSGPYYWSLWGDNSFVKFEYNHPYGGRNLEDQDKWLRYKRQVDESEGFLVERENLQDGLFGAVYPLDLDRGFNFKITVHEMAKEVASLTLDRYNRDQGSDVKFESVVRVNWSWTGEGYYYITFMAREAADGDPVEYQAKYFHEIGPKYYPIFCRPAPKP